VANVKHAFSEHDVVESREGVSGWPAGAIATVVAACEPLDSLVVVQDLEGPLQPERDEGGRP